VTAPIPPVAALLAALPARGVELAADGGRLLYRPREAVTPELAARIAERKTALLAFVCAGGEFTTAELANHAAAGASPSTLMLVRAGNAIFSVPPTETGVYSALVPARPDLLPPEWRELYEERAGVMEFEGETKRERAEALAFADIVGLMSGAVRPLRAGAVPAGGSQ
jgi:TubC N-terminal docking domain